MLNVYGFRFLTASCSEILKTLVLRESSRNHDSEEINERRKEINDASTRSVIK